MSDQGEGAEMTQISRAVATIEAGLRYLRLIYVAEKDLSGLAITLHFRFGDRMKKASTM